MILRNRWKEALLVFLLVFISSAIITKLQQPRYTSMMTFEIISPKDIINVAATNERNPIFNVMSDSGSYMQTQFEILVSQQNLIAVANKLDLSNEWHVDEATAATMLFSMIEVMPRTNTNLVDIRVEYSDPHVAQKICQAVVDCYREVRDEKERAIINEAINKRYEVLRSRQDELERKADVVRQYIRSGKYIQGMWSQNGNSVPVSVGSEEQTFADLTKQKDQMESSISQMMVHITKLQNLKDEELRDYVTRTGLLTAESYCSDRVRQLNEQYIKEQDERGQMLLTGYGERHPNVLRLEEQHKNTLRQLNEELVGMRDAMADQLDVKQAELKDLERRYQEAKDRLRDKTLEDQKVKNALQEYSAEKARYDKLENDYIVDKMRMLAPRTSVEIYSTPGVASVPSSPNYRLNLMAGAVLGVIAGIVVAFVYNYFDTSIKTLEDAERSLGLPVLGVIPQDAGLLLLQGSNAPDAEAYRILRTNIELKRKLFKSTTYTVVSANAGEGKTTTLLNLACVCAQAGYSTLMIDADMRRPRLARYAELQNDVGLTDYLTAEKELRDVVFQTSEPNLYVLPSGKIPSDPSGLLSSHRMDMLLAEVSKRFDIVLIDSTPILGVSDASLLVNKADACFFVLQPRKMPLKALTRAKDLVTNAGGNLMGVILNNVDLSGDSQYQYYTTYYSYYSKEERPGDKAPSKAIAREAKMTNDSSAKVVENESEDLY